MLQEVFGDKYGAWFGVILVTSHVNSYPLSSLERGSALDRVWPCIGAELERLGVKRIGPVEVNKSRWLASHAMVPGTEPDKKPIECSGG